MGREATRTARARRVLDAAAEAAGAAPLSPEVWELTLSDSTVVSLTRSRAELHHLSDDRGFVITFALCDVTGLIEKHGVYFGHGRKHEGEKVERQSQHIDGALEPGVIEMFLEDKIPF